MVGAEASLGVSAVSGRQVKCLNYGSPHFRWDCQNIPVNGQQRFRNAGGFRGRGGFRIGFRGRDS